MEYFGKELFGNRKEEDIDIDLSDTYFSGTVSDIHAILNYVDGFWYIEDMQSKNGTQIKGCLENKLYNIKDGQSKLTKKDYIFIGLTYVFKKKIRKYLSVLQYGHD